MCVYVYPHTRLDGEARLPENAIGVGMYPINGASLKGIMMFRNKTLFVGAFILAVVSLYPCLGAEGGPASITVQANKPGAKVSPLLWGIFFEDINLSADGGIYPELVRNRSFEDSEKPEYWKLVNQGEAKAR